MKKQKSIISIQDLPNLIKNGYFTQKQAINLIAEKIQKDPLFFGLYGTEDEIISELLLRFLQNGHLIFNNYDGNSCSFLTYLRSYLRFQILTIKREYRILTENEKIMLCEYENQAEETNKKYEEDEYPKKQFKLKRYCIQNSKTSYYYKRKQKNNTNHKIEELQFAKISSPDSKAKKLALVLALKSSVYLDLKTIKNISDFCNIPENELINLIEMLKTDVEQKKPRLQEIEKKRDRAYFMHKKIDEEIKTKDFSNKSLEKQHLQHLYDHHTNNWEKYNSKIMKSVKRCCPTNKAIANALGICERQVGYYVKHATDLKKYFKNEDV